MSITSSNNLAVSNSLTVSGNTILGSSSSSTLICNAISSFLNRLSISGNISQTSGGITISTGNIINGIKTLTTSSGTTTFNALVKFNENIYKLSGKSIYISDSAYKSFLKLTHYDSAIYIFLQVN